MQEMFSAIETMCKRCNIEEIKCSSERSAIAALYDIQAYLDSLQSKSKVSKGSSSFSRLSLSFY
jgi:hypothetical protein